ncbi:MAG: antibiotic biosynthesis monooxygenase [Dermatophilaceae bacterium]
MNHEPPVGPAGSGEFVAFSELTVPEAGRAAVIAAFSSRLGAVDTWPGFQRLQVWADQTDPCKLIMVSWWQDRESFASYMRSDDHARSHARIPGGELRPRPRKFSRFEVIAK